MSPSQTVRHKTFKGFVSNQAELGLSSPSMILHHSRGNNVTQQTPAAGSGSMLICKQILLLIAIFRDISDC